MRLILTNLAKFGEFLSGQSYNIAEVNIDTELYLQYLCFDIGQLSWDEDGLTSLIKVLLLYVSNALCILKSKEHQESLSDESLILKCLELDRALIIFSDLNDKAKSYLQYHCLVEFEYRLLTSRPSVPMFLQVYSIVW